MSEDLNSVSLTGRLTTSPELRSTASGTSVATLRVAFNTRQKSPTGEWGEKGNFINVTVWGGQADACAKFLVKGSPLAVSGRLEYREWEGEQGKRSVVEVIAEKVRFLGTSERPQPEAEPVRVTQQAAPADPVPF